jgi:hypothetical protein
VKMDKPDRCTATVHIRGLSFGRFRRCKRTATTVNAEGERVCTQHSPQAEAKRRDRQAKLQKKRFRLYIAELHARAASRKTKTKAAL